MKGTTRGDLGRIGLERTFYGRALPVIVALIMLMSSVAIAGVTSGAAAPSNARAVSPSASPSVAYGSMVSLNFVSETGPVLGGTLDALLTPPLAQSTTIVVNLPFENQTALNAFIEAVSDPYSPSYAHFLTPALFTREYSPPLADQQLVAGYLTSSGLTVTGLSPDHLSITATGTLAQLETAFDVTFAMYAQGAQTFWAPTSSPSVPSNIAPWIFGLVGLTDHASGLRPQLSLGSPDQVAGTGLLDYPNQMNWDFQLNQLYNATGNKTAGVQPSFPKGVTITQALWDEGLPTQCGYSLTDIDDYFGDLVSPAFPSEFPQPIDHAYYNVTGDPGEAPGTGACDTEGAGGNVGTETIDDVAVELTVDQEYSGEDAPGATLAPTYLNGTTLDLTNPEFIMLLNYIAAGNVPNLSVVTQSFGGNETVAYPGGEEATGYADYQELAATGVTVLASSGDDNGGSATMGEAQACESGGIPPGGYGVPGIEFPGSTPDLLSVGGTATMGASTPADPDGALTGQTVWNWCPSTDSGTSAGSTGGVSLAFPEAYYQEGIPVVNSAMLNAINVTLSGNGSANSPGGANDGLAYSATNARPDPDVAGPAAMDAVYFGQSWVTDFGGTSFSSPATAGVMGSIVAFDGHRLGMVGPALYSLESQYIAGKLPLAPTYFVRNYSNAFFNGGTYYNTSAGWGVPQAYNLALLLGKPFVSTNPQGPATVGAPYPISARVVDDRDLSYVNVSYLEPGATSWSNASLSLSSGTAENGTWSGAIERTGGNGGAQVLRLWHRPGDGELVVALQPVGVGGHGREGPELRLHGAVHGERPRVHDPACDLHRVGPHFGNELDRHGQQHIEVLDRDDDHLPSGQRGLYLHGRRRAALHGESDQRLDHRERRPREHAGQVHVHHEGDVRGHVRRDRAPERSRVERDAHEDRQARNDRDLDRVPDGSQRDVQLPDRRGVPAGQLQDHVQRDRDGERGRGDGEREVHPGPVQGHVRGDGAGERDEMDGGCGDRSQDRFGDGDEPIPDARERDVHLDGERERVRQSHRDGDGERGYGHGHGKVHVGPGPSFLVSSLTPAGMAVGGLPRSHTGHPTPSFGTDLTHRYEFAAGPARAHRLRTTGQQKSAPSSGSI